MKKNFKNLMALVLTGAMLTAGSSVFAAPDYEGGTGSDAPGATGELVGTGGQVQISGAKKIQVVMPISGRQSNFVLDPAGAMSMVEDTDIDIEKGASVYFESEYDDPYADLTAGGSLEVTKYGSTSAPMLFRNKGIMPVNFKATISAADAAAGASNMVTMKAKDFDGNAANIAISAGMVNKDGKVLADLVSVTDAQPAILNSIIDDSRNLWEIEASGFSLSYTTDAEETDFAQTGVVYQGEADVAFDWDSAIANGDVTPANYQIKTTYEFSVPEAKVIKLADLTDKTKDVLTIPGVKKASKDGGTDTLTIRFIDTVENKSTSKDVAIADLAGAVTVKADNQIEMTQAAWEGLYDMAGKTGVATMMISAPGASGIVVTVR